MSVESSPTSVAEDRVSGELPCIRCGYNLHTLSPAGQCPECGLDVALSLRSGELSHADPLWLATLSIGALLGAGTALAEALLWLVPLDSATIIDHPLYPYFYSLSFALPVALWVSTWLMTAHDREAPAPEPAASLRRMIRLAVTAATIFTLVVITGWNTTSFRWTLAGVVWALLCLAENMMFFVYVRRLGFRGGDLFVVTHAPIVMGVSIAVVLAVQVLPWSQALLRHFGLVFDVTTEPVGRLVGLLGAVYSMILLWKSRAMLERAAREARENWHGRADAARD